MAHEQLVIAAAVPSGQGLKQLGELALAFGLCALIGLEREWRQKAAGLRTYTLVGVGAAGFVIVSKYGFSDVLGSDVVLDPSRVSAAIVTGIGFIGGGLIFVRGDAVRGLTTATIVWTTAAIGMACGAGLAIIALAIATAHFIIVFLFPRIAAQLPRSPYSGFALRVVYEDGRGVLRDVLSESTRHGFSISHIETRHLRHDAPGTAAVAVTLRVSGQRMIDPLTVALSELAGVLEVASADADSSAD
ncbi:MAG TPA: MgtC/SapB family protein [Solirubrobacteraceae bacterium]|nr:MgtC/SapB family protein [Solirubrobacteraceae bacterium]